MALLASTKKISQALKDQGWKAGDNGVTLESLISGLYEGKDYSPDAFYQKVIGNRTCFFDTMIGYSNPSQPAVNISMNCFRTFDPFGVGQGVTFYLSQ